MNDIDLWIERWNLIPDGDEIRSLWGVLRPVRYLGVPALALLGTPPVMIVYGERRWWLITIVAIGLAIFARIVMVDLLQRPPLGMW